jgi:hypothetical protein
MDVLIPGQSSVINGVLWLPSPGGYGWFSSISTPVSAPTPIINSLQTTVDFGNQLGGESCQSTTTVSAPWVTLNSIIICSVAAIATPDHDAEDCVLEGITAYATNIIPGVSFDVIANSPNNTWGQYTINCISN